MHHENLPICPVNASFKEVIQVITRGRLGLAMVMDGAVLHGIITDGDIRRAFDKSSDPMQLNAVEIMSLSPITIQVNERLVTAQDLMYEAKINSLIVEDEKGEVVGVLQIYD
jgi:arabinose-5-phosphate isomerase